MTTAMQIDSSLKFGRYHVIFVALSGLPIIFTCMQVMSQIFTLGLPRHRCAIPGWPNDTFEVQSTEHQALINNTIPVETVDGERTFSSCLVYDGVLNTTGGNDTTLSTVTCSEWVYDMSVFESTAVSQMNLVCDRKMFRAHASMIYMVGYLTGVFSGGVAADRIGRKTSFCIWLAIMGAATIAQAWAPNFIALMVLRVIGGFGDGGTFVCFFVLNIEMVSSADRAALGFAIEYFWATGVTLLGGIAYGLRNWRHIQMAISFPLLACLLYCWALPESPRWLISRGRTAQAERILKLIARVNGRDIQIKALEPLTETNASKKGSIWHLVTDRQLCIRALIIFANWMVVSMVFYGLALNLGNLGGDLYLNYLISGLVEFVAYTIGFVAIRYTNRRTFHCASMMFGGIACVVTLFPAIFGKEALRWLIITLNMVGRLGATAAFACLYVYTPELFPTLFRNSITGGSSLWARVGAMIAPYIAELRNVVGGRFGVALPLLIFGGGVILAGIMAMFLPETRYEDLPNTIEDAKQIGRKSKKNGYQSRQDQELNIITAEEYTQNQI